MGGLDGGFGIWRAIWRVPGDPRRLSVSVSARATTGASLDLLTAARQEIIILEGPSWEVSFRYKGTILRA